MPIPEGYLPREGDVLLVRAHVRFDVEDDDRDGDEYQVFVRLEGDHRDCRIPLKNAVDVVSRKFNVGDEVVIAGDEKGGFGEVLAEYEDRYWLKYTRTGGRLPAFGTYAGTDLLPKPKDPVDEPFVEPQPEPPKMEYDRLRGPDGEEIKF